MDTQEKLNQIANEIRTLKAEHAANEADFIFNYAAYDSRRNRIEQLESDLKFTWLRLQSELGIQVTIAQIMA